MKLCSLFNVQWFLYNTDRQIFGILYINNIYYNNTLHTYIYINSVQTFFSSVSHALHASGNSKALTPIGREISLEMSAVYLTLPYLPAPAPLLPLGNGNVSLLGSFHCQPRWATRVTFFYLVFCASRRQLSRTVDDALSNLVPHVPCLEIWRSLDRLLAQYLINPNLFARLRLRLRLQLQL